MTIMRRLTVLAFVLLVGTLVASPAWGQGRDPFEPRDGGSDQQQPVEDDSSDRDPFDPQEGGQQEQPAVQESPDDPTDPVVQPTEVAPEPDDEVATGTLANTGFDVTTWGAVAYLMIVLGVAALVASRTFAPISSRRRR